jgi:putative FmdB family regulatory protein
MPIFEYQCQECGHIFEKFQLVRQNAVLPPCPRCQTPETRQLLSRFSSPSADGASLACAPSALS